VRQLEFFVLQYVPTPLGCKRVNVGIVLKEIGPAGFIDARFSSDWRKVTALDPDADLELLQALAREARKEFQAGSGQAWLERARDSFSSALQLTEGTICQSENPASMIEDLALAWL